ncbi:unnamed protein product [Owenia fusiformis]|uniref:Ig-like domain-containing protein n=1 Tax=Owenia fusiformis TaxID=6347 RepID=A0A8S4Q3U1_OWEFU|nr:unnamed protein product [Owenia fusiformis]
MTFTIVLGLYFLGAASCQFLNDVPLEIEVKPSKLTIKDGGSSELHCDVFDRSNRPLSESNIKCKVWWAYWSERVQNNAHYTQINNQHQDGAQFEALLRISNMRPNLEGRYTCWAECTDLPGRKFTGDVYVTYSSEKYVENPAGPGQGGYNPQTPNDSNNGALVGIIIGSVSGVILIAIIIGLVVFCKRKRRIDENIEEQQGKMYQEIMDQSNERTNNWVSQAASVPRNRAFSEDELSRMSLSSRFSESSNKYGKKKRRRRRNRETENGESDSLASDNLPPNTPNGGDTSSFDMPSVSAQTSPVNATPAQPFSFPKPQKDNEPDEPKGDATEDKPPVEGAVAVAAANLTDEILKLYNANIEEVDEEDEEDDDDVDDDDESDINDPSAPLNPKSTSHDAADEEIPPPYTDPIPPGSGARPREPSRHTKPNKHSTKVPDRPSRRTPVPIESDPEPARPCPTPPVGQGPPPYVSSKDDIPLVDEDPDTTLDEPVDEGPPPYSSPGKAAKNEQQAANNNSSTPPRPPRNAPPRPDATSKPTLMTTVV